MGLKNIFTKNKLKPYFTYSQKGNIWRIHFSGSDMLACETRDLDLKETFFFTLDYKKKQVFLSDFQLDEKWWVSIESCTDDMVFFNYFKTPELPEHAGIIAVDARTGKTNWKNSELSFLFADNSELYAYEEKYSGEVYYKLDILDGKVTETYEGEDISKSILELKRFNNEKLFAGVLYPELFVNDQDCTTEAEKYLSERFKDMNLNGPVDYIDLSSLIVYNYHEVTGIDMKDITKVNLTNKLEILDKRNGKTIHEVNLNTSAVNYVPDSFFIKEGMLFYIKEKKELTLIDLNSAAI